MYDISTRVDYLLIAYDFVDCLMNLKGFVMTLERLVRWVVTLVRGENF